MDVLDSGAAQAVESDNLQKRVRELLVLRETSDWLTQEFFYQRSPRIRIKTATLLSRDSGRGNKEEPGRISDFALLQSVTLP